MPCKGSPGKNEGVACCLLWCAPTVHTRCLNFRGRATLRSYTVNTKIQILALDYRYSILLILFKHCLFFLLVSSTGTTTSFARSTLYFIVLRGKKKNQIFSRRDFPPSDPYFTFEPVVPIALLPPSFPNMPTVSVTTV